MSDTKNWIRRYDVAQQYTIIDKVGRGTYGTVYKAKNLKSNKFLALKKLENNDQKLQAEGFPITALRQINLLKKMNHKNIIRLEEIILSKPSKRNLFRGSTFLVFDYMEHDLAGLFKNKIKFKMPEIKCIMKQLLEGVAYLHANKIMHRDIKSANILMNDNGDVRLGDFGLGRQIKLESVFTFKVVTLWYRAPELLLGCKTYTPKIDVWSLGCVFAEFIIGQILFKRQADYAQLERIYEIMGGYQQNGVSSNILSSFTYYNDLKPKKSYQPNLRQHILKLNPGVDQITMDFLEGLLCMNPQKRFSCQQALQHQFFTAKPVPCKPKQITKLEVEFHQMVGGPQMKIVRAQDQTKKKPKRRQGSQDSYKRNGTPSPESKIRDTQRNDKRIYRRDFQQPRYSVRPYETSYNKKEQRQRKPYGQRRQEKIYKEQFYSYEKKRQYERKPDYEQQVTQRKQQNKIRKYDRSESNQRKRQNKERYKQRKDRKKSHSNSKDRKRSHSKSKGRKRSHSKSKHSDYSSSSRNSYRKQYRRSREKSNIREEKHRQKVQRNFDHYKDRNDEVKRQNNRNIKEDERYTKNRDRSNFRQKDYDYSKDRRNYRQDDKRSERINQKGNEIRRQVRYKDEGYRQNSRKDEKFVRNLNDDRNNRYDQNYQREPYDRNRMGYRQYREEGRNNRDYRDQRPRNYDPNFKSKPRQQMKPYKKDAQKDENDIDY